MSESQTTQTRVGSPVPGTASGSLRASLESTVYAPEAFTRGMRRASLWLILVVVASFTYLDYWTYSIDYYAHPQTYELFLHGNGPAPAQYRVGLIFLARPLHRITHLGYRHLFTVFDFVFGLAAAFLLRRVLVATRAFQAGTLGSRWLQLAIFLGLLAFYLSWTTWYQRPETMACAFYVAASLALLCVVRSQSLVVGGLLVLALLQGFVRADVAILFHFGLFLYVAARGARDFFLARPALLVTSFLGALLPTAVLWILMHKIFPHATYGDTAVFQLFYNLAPTNIVAFVLFMVPIFYTWKRGLALLFARRAAGRAGRGRPDLPVQLGAGRASAGGADLCAVRPRADAAHG